MIPLSVNWTGFILAAMTIAAICAFVLSAGCARPMGYGG